MRSTTHIAFTALLALAGAPARAESLTDYSAAFGGGLSSSTDAASNPMQACLDRCTASTLKYTTGAADKILAASGGGPGYGGGNTCIMNCIDGGTGLSEVAAAAAKLNASAAEVDKLKADIASGAFKQTNDPFAASFIQREAQDARAAYDSAVAKATSALDNKLAQLAAEEAAAKQKEEDDFFSSLLAILGK